MRLERFNTITDQFAQLRIAVVGDFCLDRYMEIDPGKKEISLETRLPVYNVVNVRAQAGGAGTILNNLAALGVGQIFPIGFCGDDGEGFELQRAVRSQPGVNPRYLFQTTKRRTFVYCKPLLLQQGKPPVELARLDSKNWTPTPATLEGKLVDALFKVATDVDALIILDQSHVPGVGVVTSKLLGAVHTLAKTRPELMILGDSRRKLQGFPPIAWKMNRAELVALAGVQGQIDLSGIGKVAAGIAAQHGRHVFVTLAEAGLIGAAPDGSVEQIPAFPSRGPIDIVGAGDAVTANLAATLTSGATLREALEFAAAAASIVIHQPGTTGTASVGEIKSLPGFLP